MNELSVLRDVLLALAGGIAAVGAAIAAIHRWVVTPLVNSDKERAKEIAKEVVDEALVPVLVSLEDTSRAEAVARAVVTEALTPITESLEDIEAWTANISHEVNTNRGGSLKDSVMRTEGSILVLEARFNDHLADERRNT